MTTEPSTVVIGGVDTHKHTHYAAAIDDHGRLLGHQEFPANDARLPTAAGLDAPHGQVQAIGVESTGSFGATLTGHHLMARCARSSALFSSEFDADAGGCVVDGWGLIERPAMSASFGNP